VTGRLAAVHVSLADPSRSQAFEGPTGGLPGRSAAAGAYVGTLNAWLTETHGEAPLRF